MAIELSEEPVGANGAQESQKAWQLNRRYRANSEHVYRLSVVAEHQRPTGRRTPPEGLSTERNLPIIESQTDIRVEQLKLIDARSWRPGGRGGNAVRRGNEL